ncbi:MAG: helix-turn-helix domain-containing protein [Desulfotomaculaceae bacterium]|nr:helix-turn-helix domain-containing protein [Desulfotomaculaceae bacterium]
MRKVLIQKRKGAGFTQESIAIRLNISLSFYRKIEQGSRNPGLELAQNIAKLLRTTVEEIFFESSGHVECPAATGTTGN